MPEPLFQQFINAYRSDPAALMQYTEVMRHASVAQMQRTISALNLDHAHYLKPVIMPGAALADAQGLPLERLSLLAVRDSGLIPIPFQFDEYDQHGLIWTPQRTFADPAGKPGLLDELDELVFMFRDAGETRYDSEQHGPAQGTLLKEIVLDRDNGPARFAYLMLDNPQRSTAHYVDVDLDAGHIQSTVLEMNFDPKNLIRMHDIAARVGPHAGENVFDNVHVSLSTGILSKHLRFSLDTESNIRAVPLAVARGPVRNTVRVKMRIWYLGMPTFVDQDIHIHFYEQGIVVPIPFAVNSIGSLRYFVSLLREPRFQLHVDFHQLDGAQVTFESVFNNQDDSPVDGWMSDYEVGMNYARLPGAWLHMDSHRGWQMFFVNGVPLLEGGLFDQFLTGAELGMVYKDDDTLQAGPMRYTGVMPRIGFQLQGMPEPALNLLKASPKVPKKIDTLGQAILWLAENPARLQRYDKAARPVFARLKKRGLIATPEALAELFIADMGRMNFRGIPRQQLDLLMRDAIADTVTDTAEVRHGEILARMAALAAERNIDLGKLQRATINMALWFPDALGEQGPEGFYQQMSQPVSSAVLAPMLPDTDHHSPSHAASIESLSNSDGSNTAH